MRFWIKAIALISVLIPSFFFIVQPTYALENGYNSVAILGHRAVKFLEPLNLGNNNVTNVNYMCFFDGTCSNTWSGLGGNGSSSNSSFNSTYDTHYKSDFDYSTLNEIPIAGSGINVNGQVVSLVAPSCNTGEVLTNTSGSLSCVTDQTGGGGGNTTAEMKAAINSSNDAYNIHFVPKANQTFYNLIVTNLLTYQGNDISDFVTNTIEANVDANFVENLNIQIGTNQITDFVAEVESNINQAYVSSLGFLLWSDANSQFYNASNPSKFITSGGVDYTNVVLTNGSILNQTINAITNPRFINSSTANTNFLNRTNSSYFVEITNANSQFYNSSNPSNFVGSAFKTNLLFKNETELNSTIRNLASNLTTTTCSGTDKVSAINNATGVVTCSADVSGGSGSFDKTNIIYSNESLLNQTINAVTNIRFLNSTNSTPFIERTEGNVRFLNRTNSSFFVEITFANGQFLNKTNSSYLVEITNANSQFLNKTNSSYLVEITNGNAQWMNSSTANTNFLNRTNSSYFVEITVGNNQFMNQTLVNASVRAWAPNATTITCSGNDKFSAYNNATGVFTCTTDQTGAGGPFDKTNIDYVNESQQFNQSEKFNGGVNFTANVTLSNTTGIVLNVTNGVVSGYFGMLGSGIQTMLFGSTSLSTNLAIQTAGLTRILILDNGAVGIGQTPRAGANTDITGNVNVTGIINATNVTSMDINITRNLTANQVMFSGLYYGNGTAPKQTVLCLGGQVATGYNSDGNPNCITPPGGATVKSGSVNLIQQNCSYVNFVTAFGSVPDISLGAQSNGDFNDPSYNNYSASGFTICVQSTNGTQAYAKNFTSVNNANFTDPIGNATTNAGNGTGGWANATMICTATATCVNSWAKDQSGIANNLWTNITTTGVNGYSVSNWNQSFYLNTSKIPNALINASLDFNYTFQNGTARNFSYNIWLVNKTGKYQMVWNFTYTSATANTSAQLNRIIFIGGGNLTYDGVYTLILNSSCGTTNIAKSYCRGSWDNVGLTIYNKPSFRVSWIATTAGNG